MAGSFEVATVEGFVPYGVIFREVEFPHCSKVGSKGVSMKLDPAALQSERHFKVSKPEGSHLNEK